MEKFNLQQRHQVADAADRESRRRRLWPDPATMNSWPSPENDGVFQISTQV